jgi:hypothetical protein
LCCDALHITPSAIEADVCLTSRIIDRYKNLRNALQRNVAGSCGRSELSRTVRGATAGNIAFRSLMCASPSLRNMLWAISTVRLVRGEHVDAIHLVKMSSRGVNTVEPSCGANAIGASFPSWTARFRLAGF